MSVMLSTHGIILMYSYEMLKERLKNNLYISESLQPLVSGVISKTLASTVLYPLATVRTRIQ
jgi:hypothetical protein